MLLVNYLINYHLIRRKFPLGSRGQGTNASALMMNECEKIVSTSKHHVPTSMPFILNS